VILCEAGRGTRGKLLSLFADDASDLALEIARQGRGKAGPGMRVPRTAGIPACRGEVIERLRFACPRERVAAWFPTEYKVLFAGPLGDGLMANRSSSSEFLYIFSHITNDTRKKMVFDDLSPS